MLKVKDFFLYILFLVLSLNFVFFYLSIQRNQNNEKRETLMLQYVSKETKELRLLVKELQKNDEIKHSYINSKITSLHQYRSDMEDKLTHDINDSFEKLQQKQSSDFDQYKFLFEEIEILRKMQINFVEGKVERERREDVLRVQDECEKKITYVKKNKNEMYLEHKLRNKNIPCYEHCCFQFRISIEKVPNFYGKMTRFKRMMYDYTLPVSYGPFQDPYQFKSNETLLMSMLNNYTIAGLYYPDCLYRELAHVIQNYEDEIFLLTHGRKNVTLEDVYRIDRQVVDYVRGIVRYRLHGRIKEYDNYLRRNKSMEISNRLDCVEMDREGDEYKIIRQRNSYGTTIHVGVGIRDVNDQFYVFLEHFKSAMKFDKKMFSGRVKLIVINLDDTTFAETNTTHSNVTELLLSFFDEEDFTYVAHNDFLFSKVKCFQSVIELVRNPNDIILLIDVDMIIPKDFFYRVRSFTRKGNVIYNPVCFSQKKGRKLQNDGIDIDANEAWHVLHRSGNVEWDPHSQIKFSNGFWRKFGVGIIAGYRSDFDAIGGYNTIRFHEKWGHEDVDIVDRFIKEGYTIFHSAEMNYFHAYHYKRGWGTWRNVVRKKLEYEREREIERRRLKKFFVNNGK